VRQPPEIGGLSFFVPNRRWLASGIIGYIHARDDGGQPLSRYYPITPTVGGEQGYFSLFVIKPSRFRYVDEFKTTQT